MNERQITAKYPGKCRDCGSYFEAGESIMWSKGYGCRHITCENLVAAGAKVKDEIQLEAEMAESSEADTGDHPDGTRDVGSLYDGVDPEAMAEEWAEAKRVNIDYSKIEKRVVENLRQKGSNTGASFALLYGTGREAPSYDYKAPVDKIEGACDLCGSLGLCGCDEPEKGNAYLDLMDLFESKGMEVDQIPANAYPVTNELFMGISGIYRKRDKLLCIAPTTEHSALLKKVA